MLHRAFSVALNSNNPPLRRRIFLRGGSVELALEQQRTQSNKFSVWFTTAPSIASILSLVATPPLAENPPGLPPAASTRWHGTTIGQGLRPSAWPTSRDSSTPPSRLAISP